MDHWRILVVDDDQNIATQTAQSLQATSIWPEGEAADAQAVTSFADALELLDQRHYDLLVLDVRDQSAERKLDVTDDHGSEATPADLGLDLYKKVRERRFVPIIFFTALPNLVRGDDMAPAPFVAVVSKTAADPTSELRARVREVFGSTLPAIHRALLGHVDEIVRDFMLEFVQPHWSELSSPTRKGDLAHLLLRRLALSLAGGGEVLATRLAGTPGVQLTKDQVHPMRYYVVPPVGSWTTGDVVRGPALRPDRSTAAVDGTAPIPPVIVPSWYVVLTPACDLVEPRVKADFVVLAECVPLEEAPEYTSWVEVQPAGEEESSRAGRSAESRLEKLMRNNPDGRPRDRNLYLPAAWSVPDLLVDFQRIHSIPYADLASLERVATLDSPYAEVLVERFGRYLGRLGAPDLDVDIPLGRLRSAQTTLEVVRTNGALSTETNDQTTEL